jgi:hypothetical protein
MLRKKYLNFIPKSVAALQKHPSLMGLLRQRLLVQTTFSPYSYFVLSMQGLRGHALYVCPFLHLPQLFFKNQPNAALFLTFIPGELLQTMCDPLKLNGETGYYLASFYAAMTHINELDLTEANDELSIFLDVLPD